MKNILLRLFFCFLLCFTCSSKLYSVKEPDAAQLRVEELLKEYPRIDPQILFLCWMDEKIKSGAYVAKEKVSRLFRYLLGKEIKLKQD